MRVLRNLERSPARVCGVWAVLLPLAASTVSASEFLLEVTANPAIVREGQCAGIWVVLKDPAGKRVLSLPDGRPVTSASFAFSATNADAFYWRNDDPAQGYLCAREGAGGARTNIVAELKGTDLRGMTRLSTLSPGPTVTRSDVGGIAAAPAGAAPGTPAAAGPATGVPADSSPNAVSPAAASALPPAKPETVDAVAVTIAADLGGLPVPDNEVLISAVRYAGFSVLLGSQDRVEPYYATDWPLVLADWEIEATGRLLESGATTGLLELGQSLAPGNTALAQRMIADIALAARHPDPARRFWARLIVERGRRAVPAYDLLAATDAAAVQLDAVQAMLILKVLAADLLVAAEHARPTAAAGTSGWLDRIASSTLAWFRRPMLIAAANAQSRSPDCADMDVTMIEEARKAVLRTSTLGKIVVGIEDLQTGDSMARARGFAFGKAMELLDEAGLKAAREYADFVSKANVALTYLKVFWSYAALDVQIRMENSPLVRNKSRAAGEQRKLIATARMNMGEWPKINCFRYALNNVGLDFSLPPDGALPDAGLQWLLLEGGTKVNLPGGAGRRVDDAIVAWVNPGPRIQDAGVGFQHVRDFTRTTTNSRGVASVDIQGAERRYALTPPLAPVYKQATVQVAVRLEAGSFLNAVSDATGQVGMLVTLPASLLMKSHWYTSPKYRFPVKDWEECEGSWGGSIRYRSEKKDSGIRNDGPGKHDSWRSFSIREATVSIDNDSPAGDSGNELPAELQGIFRGSGVTAETLPAKSTGLVSSESHNASQSTFSVQCSANPVTMDHRTQSRNDSVVENGSISGPTSLQLLISPDGSYSISAATPSIPVKIESTYRAQATTSVGWCGNQTSDSHTSSGDRNDGISILAEGKIDPERPRVLEGSSKTQDPGFGTVEIDWEIVRCR